MGYLARFALFVGAAALLAGCGGSQLPISAPGATPPASALSARGTKYRVLYSFGVPPDGAQPGSLLDVGGTLYGTTLYGGSYNACYDYFTGCGTIFSVTTGGIEKVLFSFHGSDGEEPESLLDVGGTLYGTTAAGGTDYNCGYSVGYGCGTVFSITTSGTEKVLYDFGARNTHDGTDPNSGLIDVKGTLYGTTALGGAYPCGTYDYHGCGTAFSVTMGGTEKVLYSFDGADGERPIAGLIHADGKYYGTTNEGGAYSSGEYRGGTVFSMTRRGRVKVLHSFGAANDGLGPDAPLVEVKGTFYGTTAAGGAYGYGTFFSVTAAGTERVLYSFRGGNSDGSAPSGSLINVKGTLYGTTRYGGPQEPYCRNTVIPGCGTVFSITTSGQEKVLHFFGARTDGVNRADGISPNSLIYVSGTFYGTTHAGGANKSCFDYGGCGTVFALTP